MTVANPVLTIGHSTHSVDAFLGLLRQHGVTAIADVRSVPFSRFNPQFTKAALHRCLRDAGVQYVFLGRELGARPSDPTCYEAGRVQYARLAATEPFREGIERVIRGAGEYRIALLCAEKEPLDCHRTILVSRVLAERGIPVEHIHGDGRLERHKDAMLRLLDLHKLPRGDLFQSSDEHVQRALILQEEKIAFVAKGNGDEAPKETA